MLDLRVLNNLVVVAQEANISRAAERLNLSQPALSRSIAQLEAQFGLRLLDRSRTGVTLTNAGEDLLTKARGLLGEAVNIENDMLMQSRGDSGRIRLGVGPLVSGIAMEQLLIQSLVRWPMLSVVIDVEPTMNLVLRLMDAEIDCCICAGSTLEPNPALAITVLAQIQMGFFVRAGHPLLTCSTPFDPKHMALYPRMTGRSPNPFAASFQSIFEGQPPTLECDNFSILKQVALHTDAILYASDRVISDELQSGKLIELPMSAMPGTREIDIVLAHLKNRTLSPATQQVIGVARSVLQMEQGGTARFSS
ncbi:LysR family transcriptional regulator [Blastomonas fulva]|uniref:LysR family transcriptional regulator n=1 Tax=Blastomonas fulva TaxID=1550728 RepID=UPI003D2A1422